MGAKQEVGLEGYKAQLIHRQQELWRVSSETVDGRQTVEADSANSGRLSRASALQSQALAQETDRRRQAELKRIAFALARLDDGEFGHCAVCGDEIAVERLRMDPAVATCIECARQR
jgi:DnaK suppressor protein